jgi:hypothetical protein
MLFDVLAGVGIIIVKGLTSNERLVQAGGFIKKVV